MARRGEARARTAVIAIAVGIGTTLVPVAPASAAAAELTFLEVEKDGVGGVSGINQPLDLAFAPDGDNLYVVGGASNSVAAFHIDSGEADLDFDAAVVDGSGGVDGIAGARGIAVSPGGEHVYVAGNTEDAVATFLRNLDGSLTFLEEDVDNVSGVDGLDGAWAVTVAPDGGSVYVTGDVESSVAVFDRDPATGLLTYVEAEKDGAGGVDGIANATGVAVSPDNQHVYVTGCLDNGVAAFTRDPVTSALTFVGEVENGQPGVSGLACARGVAVSPDGKYVTVAAETGDSLVTFTRDATSGALTFASKVTDGVGGVTGLNGVRDVAFSPDGTQAFGAGYVADALAAFSRDAATGALTFVEAEVEGVGGVDGVNGPAAIVVQPDGAGVYTSGETEDSVAVFTRDTTVPPTPPATTPASRTVTLEASKTKVVKGKKVKFSGSVASATASCASGVPVQLRKKVGKKPYKLVATLTANAQGKYKTKRKVTKKAKYQVLVVATPACGAAQSKPVKIKLLKP
jgi:6-phosphogluconolactonase (cycloisomerase 2 family)